jgi:hypothetical protein
LYLLRLSNYSHQRNRAQPQALLKKDRDSLFGKLVRMGVSAYGRVGDMGDTPNERVGEAAKP